MSREDPQMKIRLPADLKDSIETAAKANNRTMNSEIVARLEASFTTLQASGSIKHIPQEDDEGFLYEIIRTQIELDNATQALEEARTEAKDSAVLLAAAEKKWEQGILEGWTIDQEQKMQEELGVRRRSAKRKIEAARFAQQEVQTLKSHLSHLHFRRKTETNEPELRNVRPVHKEFTIGAPTPRSTNVHADLREGNLVTPFGPSQAVGQPSVGYGEASIDILEGKVPSKPSVNKGPPPSPNARKRIPK